jgi:hypothetical protein
MDDSLHAFRSASLKEQVRARRKRMGEHLFISVCAADLQGEAATLY